MAYTIYLYCSFASLCSYIIHFTQCFFVNFPAARKYNALHEKEVNLQCSVFNNLTMEFNNTAIINAQIESSWASPEVHSQCCEHLRFLVFRITKSGKGGRRRVGAWIEGQLQFVIISICNRVKWQTLSIKSSTLSWGLLRLVRSIHFMARNAATWAEPLRRMRGTWSRGRGRGRGSAMAIAFNCEPRCN